LKNAAVSESLIVCHLSQHFSETIKLFTLLRSILRRKVRDIRVFAVYASINLSEAWLKVTSRGKDLEITFFTALKLDTYSLAHHLCKM